MENQVLVNRLQSICEVKLNEKMSNHTSLRCGGACDIMVLPDSCDELGRVLKTVREFKAEYIVIGNGSNILVRDGGVEGVVIKLGKTLDYIRTDGERIIAGAGSLLSRIAMVALENSLKGFEFAAGIPGSVGGAVYMNAGAYGGEMKDVVERVLYIDKNGDVQEASGDTLGLSYRHSMFTDNPELVITEVTIKLANGNKDEIKTVMDDLAERRRSKQPLEYPSAGSTFKRPEGYFAAKLIEDSGLKGFSIGGAMVSEKHAGFVINKDNATAQDVLDVIQHVRETVKEKFEVELEEEVRIIGR